MLPIADIYKQNITLIFKYFRLRTFSKEIAEDLASETFLRFVSKRELLETAKIESAKAYLYGMARKIFLEYLRNKYKREITLSISEVEFYEHVAGYVAEFSSPDRRQAQLEMLIPQLPEKQRQIVSLRLIEKKSITEIIAITGKDSNYVRTTQKRAVASLRKLWECTQPGTNLIELTQNHE